MNQITLMTSSIGNDAVDERGKIFPFIPKNDIKEFVYIETVPGQDRGHHWHPEFDEYIVLTSGNGKFIERTDNGTREIKVTSGDCVHIPQGVYHTFIAETKCTSMSCLTKKWDDCNNPILR
jgi:mannose-6-phosphate isomerase-like protein (cupin superfamily)